MKYHTIMSESSLVRFRRLPDGEFQPVKDATLDGNVLQFTLLDGQQSPTSGALLEIESDAKVYLGEVRQCKGSVIKIVIEHILDRARLASMKDTWR
jgi:hypothetical protein